MFITTTLMTSFLLTPASVEFKEVSLIKEESHYSKKTLSKFEQNYLNLAWELESFKTLGNNWDGYGSEAPLNDVVAESISFLKILENKGIEKPEVFPSSNGEIGFYWKNHNDYIEVSICEDKKLSFFYDFENDLYGKEKITISSDLPSELLDAIKSLNEDTDTVNISNLFIHNTSTEDTFLVA